MAGEICRMSVKNFLSLITALFFVLSFPIKIFAQSYNYDIWGDAIPSQAGYTALKSISGNSLSIGDFSSLSDLCRTSDGSFFIADSGNNRIIKVNNDFSEVIRIIENISFNGNISSLKNPNGIYCSPYDNFLYIADTDNSRVIKCDENGIADMIIEKPHSILYTDTENSGFFPQKVITDNAGFIYVIVSSSSNGAMMFNSDGEFMGYYGANRSELTFDIIKHHIFSFFSTYSINSKNIRNVPSSFTNFDIDKSGFMFTCTETNSNTDTVKKINSKGDNLFAYSDRKFGDYTEYYDVPQSAITDIDISESGYINCLDRTSGRVFQYDENLRLICITGGKSDTLGGFKNVSAIESSDDYIYVADSEKNTITIFKISQFGENIHNALELSKTGQYKKALPMWINVLEYDGNYYIACEEISNAMFYMGDYKSAMDYARRCFSSELYNRTFEEYRFEFLMQNSFLCIIILISAFIIIIALNIRNKKSEKISYTMDNMNYFQWCIYAVTHPIDSMEDIIWKKKYSPAFIGFILILFLISEIFCDRLYGLQFHAQYSKTFSIFSYIFSSIILFFMWTAGNWSVCCLLDGKGTFKNICAVSAYSLIPYIMQNFTVTILSHFLVYDEKFFLTAIILSGILWSAVMMFSALKTIHQYSIRKTIYSIILTFIAMAVIFFLMVLFFSLFRQICSFIYELITEIIYRIKV